MKPIAAASMHTTPVIAMAMALAISPSFASINSVSKTTFIDMCRVMSNGCSVPNFLRGFDNNRDYVQIFGSACDSHDLCYYCVSNVD